MSYTLYIKDAKQYRSFNIDGFYGLHITMQTQLNLVSNIS